MTDTLEIFGVEYTNVAGIIAKDDNGDDQTYIKGGSDFNVTLTQDSTEKWIPDCTYAEVVAAYNSGKTITFTAGYPAIRAGFDSYDEFGATITYYVDEYFSDLTDTGLNIKYYRWHGNSNITLDSSEVYHITSNANAQPSDVVKDKVFYNADGYQVGTATGGTPTLQSKTYNVSSAGTATVTADSGYDGLSSVSVSVPNYSFGVHSDSIEVDSEDWLLTRTYPNQTSGYLSEIDGFYVNLDVENKTVNPSSSSQIVTPTDETCYLNSVTVNAIPTDYVGTGITRRSSPDLTASGATVTVPSGYYSAQASKAVASGTEGTPTATKGTVSNHQVSVTPSVTNTTGYITGGTKTGTAVSVSASELVSGTYTVDSSGTKDVTNYASASVPAGTAGTPSASKGVVSNHSVSVTPSVTNTTGWITGSTKTGAAVTVSASELVSGSETKTANGTYDVTNLASLVVDIDFVTYYTGTTVPSTLADGDIFLKVVS